MEVLVKAIIGGDVGADHQFSPLPQSSVCSKARVTSSTVQIEKFTDQYQLLAEAYGITVAALSELLRNDDRPRWIVVRNGGGIGVAVAWRDPDRRVRLSVTCRDSTAYQALIRAAVDDINTDVYASVSGSDLLLRRAFTSEGFRLDFTEDIFTARFTAAARALRTARLPKDFTVITADRADGRSWFTLDNTLRQDVRGNEGWRGDLKWFASHTYESPDFDASACLIAVDDLNAEYAGLVRFSNNAQAAPRLEMLAVLRQYRRGGLGKALLSRAVDAASTWGHDTFTGVSARDSAVMRSMWVDMGANDSDSQQTLVRRRRV